MKLNKYRSLTVPCNGLLQTPFASYLVETANSLPLQSLLEAIDGPAVNRFCTRLSLKPHFNSI